VVHKKREEQLIARINDQFALRNDTGVAPRRDVVDGARELDAQRATMSSCERS
jgi:hypothetical protein